MACWLIVWPLKYLILGQNVLFLLRFSKAAHLLLLHRNNRLVGGSTTWSYSYKIRPGIGNNFTMPPEWRLKGVESTVELFLPNVYRKLLRMKDTTTEATK